MEINSLIRGNEILELIQDEKKELYKVQNSIERLTEKPQRIRRIDLQLGNSNFVSVKKPVLLQLLGKLENESKFKITKLERELNNL